MSTTYLLHLQNVVHRILGLSVFRLLTVPSGLSLLQIWLMSMGSYNYLAGLNSLSSCLTVSPSGYFPYLSICILIRPTDNFICISPCYFEFKFFYFAWHICELHFPLPPTLCNFCCFLYIFYTPESCTSTFATFLSVNPHPLRLQPL